MKLAFFVDQIFWQDEAGYSSDESYTLFPLSFSNVYDEVVFIGRLAPEAGRKPYALPSTAVNVCALPYYASVYDVWRSWPQLKPKIRQIIEAQAHEWDVVLICGPNPVGQYIAELLLQMKRPVVLVVRQNLIQQVRFANRGLRQWLGVAMAAWLEWRFRRLARGRVVFAVGEEMTAAYGKVTPHAYNHFACLIDETQMRALSHITMQPDANRLLFVGRLSSEKGLYYLFQALVKLRDLGKHYVVDIVGSGRQEEELRAMVRTLGLDEQVIFHGYVPYGDELYALYRRATALVVPSLHGEGFPQVINEALAVGLPVVASRVGGIPAFLTHDKTGLLVPPADVNRLAEAIEQICADGALRQTLLQNGQTLMRHNTLEANRDRLIKIIESEVLYGNQDAPAFSIG